MTSSWTSTNRSMAWDTGILVHPFQQRGGRLARARRGAFIPLQYQDQINRAAHPVEVPSQPKIFADGSPGGPAADTLARPSNPWSRAKTALANSWRICPWMPSENTFLFYTIIDKCNLTVSFVPGAELLLSKSARTGRSGCALLRARRAHFWTRCCAKKPPGSSPASSSFDARRPLTHGMPLRKASCILISESSARFTFPTHRRLSRESSSPRPAVCAPAKPCAPGTEAEAARIIPNMVEQWSVKLACAPRRCACPARAPAGLVQQQRHGQPRLSADPRAPGDHRIC